MKIAVVGIGYVGLSNAVLLAHDHEVRALNRSEDKAARLNNGISPIEDKDIAHALKDDSLRLFASNKAELVLPDADLTIIATPTDYDSERQYFDTGSVKSALIQIAQLNPDSTVIIRSTVPVGYTDQVRREFKSLNILFSPEFLREGKALYDNYYPSRIIIGADDSQKDSAIMFSNIMKSSAKKKQIPVLIMPAAEAESVKLFANTYLAMRVSFFNELDTFAEVRGMDSRNLIAGICMDPRIGDYYNNPSFGYGGYCLPKDTKQLLVNYKNVPANLIESIVKANDTRKKYIADRIVELLNNTESTNPTVGVYRLTMKTGSDNFRQSAVQSVMEILKQRGIRVIVYEPSIKTEASFRDCTVVRNFQQFKEEATIIIANRYNDELHDVIDKLYTRDIYRRD
ncbi:MAG: nucleotide sugar dehydrogenase [Oscillospiraceae bacterium]|nr:nucleotide sugar dehydrogenase [Oscillospiraceae bacterium]